MKNTIVEKSVNCLIRKDIIQESEKELYQFGVNGLYLFLINVITTIIVGAFLSMVWQSILFTTAYIPLRCYVGGYHAKTSKRCYCISVLFIVCVLLILKYISFSEVGIISIVLLSAGVIFFKAPVESENRPLNKNEEKFFGLKARVILSIEIFVVLLLKPFVVQAAICIAIAIGSVGCAAVVGILLKKLT